MGPGLGSAACEPDRDAARLASRPGRPYVFDAVVGRQPVDFECAPDTGPAAGSEWRAESVRRAGAIRRAGSVPAAGAVRRAGPV
jgi:hypothetical protein